MSLLARQVMERARASAVLALMAIGSGVAACASTPREAVELSVTVGRDVQSVHAAHVALANLYFDRMEADVDTFVDTQYRPYSIERSMKKFGLIEKVTDPAKAGGLDALDVMQVFVEEITRDIEAFRGELLDPIRAQRQKVLGSLEGAYRQIQDGNAIVTGHLASIVTVQDAQDEVLAKLNLAGLRQQTVDATAAASLQIAEITRKAEYGRSKVEEFQKAIEQLEKASQSLGK
jgi:hypothetical protein